MYKEAGKNSIVLATAKAYRSLSGLYYKIAPVPLRAITTRPIVIAIVQMLKDDLIKVTGTMGTVAVQVVADEHRILASMEMALRAPTNPASLHLTNSIRYTIEEHFASLVEFWLKTPHANYEPGVGLVAWAKQNTPIAPCAYMPPHMLGESCRVFGDILLMERDSEYGPILEGPVGASWRAGWRGGRYTFTIDFGDEPR